MHARAIAIVVALAAPMAVLGAAMGVMVSACGSRTGLLTDGEGAPGSGGGGDDAGTPMNGIDASMFADDVFVTVPEDAPLPILDATPLRDVNTSICADASDTLIYVVTTSNALLRFDPASGTFARIGLLQCPDPRNPFSMAVDRTGAAYVLYANYGDTTPGVIFRVSLTDAQCEATTYAPGQDGFDSFGMGFAANDVGNGETLFVASDDTVDGRLGAIDETSLTLTDVGDFTPTITGAELTGTADGRLFAFYAPGGQGSSGSAIAQIDKTTAAVVAQNELPQVTQGRGWAFGFWGGDFYLFTSQDGATSQVTRYDPSDGSLATVATYPEMIVGAGVSTCAPVQ